jgi:hypothetical protein
MSFVLVGIAAPGIWKIPKKISGIDPSFWGSVHQGSPNLWAVILGSKISESFFQKKI